MALHLINWRLGIVLRQCVFPSLAFDKHADQSMQRIEWSAFSGHAKLDNALNRHKARQ